MADLSNWLTTQQVAEALHMNVRDVERQHLGVPLESRRSRCIDGQQREWVYDPATVEAIRASTEKADLEANPLLKSLVLNNLDLLEIYKSLGYSPTLRDQMVELASKIRACCDPASLAALEESLDLDAKVLLTPDGARSLESALAYSALAHPSHEHIVRQGHWDAAVKARADLLRELQNKWGSFCEPEGNRVNGQNIRTVLHDGVVAVDPGSLASGEVLRKQAFDGLLFDIAVGVPRKEESDRPAALAFAATEYLRTPWMHNRWVTERLVMDIFKLLRTDVRKTNLYPRFWPILMAGTAALVCYYFRLIGIASMFLAVTLLGSVAVILRIRNVDRLWWEVDQVARELGEDWFCGKVLARRVERLYELGIPVPPVLPALLELLP